jgi:hypothetical protein
MIISNELLRFTDASTAVIGRIILLVLRKSWLGHEDTGLETKIRKELPGILNWSLDGLDRLLVTNKNCFTVTAATEAELRDMADMASPVRAFVREKCELGADYSVSRDLLYSAYKLWCEANGHQKAAKSVFGKNLNAACPEIPSSARGRKGKTVSVFMAAYDSARHRPRRLKGSQETYPRPRCGSDLCLKPHPQRKVRTSRKICLDCLGCRYHRTFGPGSPGKFCARLVLLAVIAPDGSARLTGRRCR